MGRKIIIRPNYRADCAFLQRLIGAIEIDERIGLESKKRLMESLREAVIELVSLPSELEKKGA